MITTDQVKKIAEHMPFEVKPMYEAELLHYQDKDRWTIFDPIDDRDNHKVFKALVDECKKEDINIAIEEGVLLMVAIRLNNIFPLFTSELNNENVCSALLAVIGFKDD